MAKNIAKRTTRMKPQFCPACFAILSATSAFDADVSPEPGDFTVCAYCAAVLKFDESMMLLPSSLIEVPTHSRKGFVDMVTKVKQAKDT